MEKSAAIQAARLLNEIRKTDGEMGTAGSTSTQGTEQPLCWPSRGERRYSKGSTFWPAVGPRRTDTF